MKFNKWLDTFVSEKGLNLEAVFEADGKDFGANFIPLGSIVEFIKACDDATKSTIKTNFVKIDFMNGDVNHFFQYIANGMAI